MAKAGTQGRIRYPAASPIAFFIVIAVVVFLVGCGPTRTAGTGGLAARDLAVLSIAQLPAKTYVQIGAVQFDGEGDQYKIGKGRDFYLRPGDSHTATFTFTAKVPGLLGWLVPGGGNITIPSPIAVPMGAVAAGKAYELAPTLESFDKMLQDGELSLVREKVK